MKNVVLVTNIPTPYRIPLFNELSKQLQEHGFSFEVIFAASGYSRRKWKINLEECSFQYHILNSRRLPTRNHEHAIFTYTGLNRYVSRNASLVIVGGFSLASTKVWLNSFVRGTPYLIWSGAITQKNSKDSLPQRIQRQLLVRRARAFISYGTRAKEYLVGLGADPRKVFVGINTVDCRFFQEKASRGRQPELADSRQKEILYVGNLEKGKRLDHVLQAIKILAERRSDFILKLIGTGSQETELKELASKLGIQKYTDFVGFVQKDEIATKLATADCFVFPSEYDVWGLALIEAMAAGVPCLSSIYAGATRDVINDGETGFALDFSKADLVADRLCWILDHRREAAELGRRGQAFVEEHVSLTVSAAGFVRAIEFATGQPTAVERVPLNPIAAV